MISKILEIYTNENRHQKQKEFHANPSRNRWVFGGNRTGKTECGAVEAVRWATRRPVEGWVVSLSRQMSRDITQAKILKYLDKSQIIETVMHQGRKGSPEYGVIDFIIVLTKCKNLSKITFKSCEQGREKFQGTGLDFVWFDEEPPEDIYEECLIRTLDKEGSCVWATMTPLKGKTWVYDKIYLNQSGDISVMFMSWEDNPYLLPSEIKKMQSALSSDALESRKYGRFMEGTGLVFSEFCADANVIDPFDIPKAWYTCVSIDPGYTSPTAALWLSVDADANIYVVADYYVAEKQVDHHAREVKRISEQLGFENPYVIIDSNATARTIGNPESVAQQFLNYGIKVDPKVDKTVIEGIMKVKGLLKNVDGLRKLFIFRNCINLIKEIKDYWWGDNERPVKKDDHCIDALRYFVSTVYENSKPRAIMAAPREKKNILGTTKLKFIREAKNK
jgi:phage terminase large subunit-like protein